MGDAMIVKWRTDRFSIGIERVECTRVSEHSLWVAEGDGRERRYAVRSSSDRYHDSWSDAYSYLLERARSRTVYKRRELEREEADLASLEAMEGQPVA
jgi:hypothetical protein